MYLLVLKKLREVVLEIVSRRKTQRREPSTEDARTGPLPGGDKQKTKTTLDQGFRNPDVDEFVELASGYRISHYNLKLILHPGKESIAADSLVRERGPEALSCAYQKFLKNKDDYLSARRHPFGLFASQVDDYLGPKRVIREKSETCRDCGTIRTWSTVYMGGGPERGPRLNPDEINPCPTCAAIEEMGEEARNAILAEVPKETADEWKKASDLWFRLENRRSTEHISLEVEKVQTFADRWLQRVREIKTTKFHF
jgi:hypothetical protein